MDTYQRNQTIVIGVLIFIIGIILGVVFSGDNSEELMKISKEKESLESRITSQTSTISKLNNEVEEAEMEIKKNQAVSKELSELEKFKPLGSDKTVKELYEEEQAKIKAEKEAEQKRIAEEKAEEARKKKEETEKREAYFKKIDEGVHQLVEGARGSIGNASALLIKGLNEGNTMSDYEIQEMAQEYTGYLQEAKMGIGLAITAMEKMIDVPQDLQEKHNRYKKAVEAYKGNPDELAVAIDAYNNGNGTKLESWSQNSSEINAEYELSYESLSESK